MKNIKNTRNFIELYTHYISGETIDFGAGTAKYQSIIRPMTSHYTTFDVRAGKNIDVVGDVLNPPFSNGSFDTVISTQVLEHVEKPWVMIAQIGRIIKPGGLCILTAPFMFPFHADPNDFFRFSQKGIESMFINENFEIIDVGTYGKIFSLFSEMIHFTFFNPYTSKGHSRVAGRIMRMIENLAVFLDRFVRSETIYLNVYVVARKKK